MIRRRLLLLLLPLALGACAGTQPRFPTEDVNLKMTPQAAVREPMRGQKVLWGGVIVNSSNLEDATQIEVLAYPLRDSQRPDTNRAPTGRFLALKPGYLETADFAAGRLLTVRGALQDTATGKVGQADYTYPVVEVEDTQLWKADPASSVDPRPRVSFGIGVMIGR